MKKIVKTLMPAMYLMVIAFSAASCNKTQAAPATATVAPGQPVDLTYAAEKSLPAVVYIKSVTNSKVQTVEYSDPFEDFFSDPCGGFFGRGRGNNGKRQRQVQTPKRAAAGSGVII
jgi:S1-C subfamily serine protease